MLLLGAQLQLRRILKRVRVSLGLAASLLSPGVFVGETGTVKPLRRVWEDTVPPVAAVVTAKHDCAGWVWKGTLTNQHLSFGKQTHLLFGSSWIQAACLGPEIVMQGN